MIEFDPALEATFQKVIADHTAGDPMRLDVKWTNLSRRQIAKRMQDLGTPVSRDVVSQLLKSNRPVNPVCPEALELAKLSSSVNPQEAL